MPGEINKPQGEQQNVDVSTRIRERADDNDHGQKGNGPPPTDIQQVQGRKGVWDQTTQIRIKVDTVRSGNGLISEQSPSGKDNDLGTLVVRRLHGLYPSPSTGVDEHYGGRHGRNQGFPGSQSKITLPACKQETNAENRTLCPSSTRLTESWRVARLEPGSTKPHPQSGGPGT